VVAGGVGEALIGCNEGGRLASGKLREYYGRVISKDASVSRRGITVLSLLLLIIALAVVAFFLLRYLRAAG
jgi:uncharacterized membrane protein